MSDKIFPVLLSGGSGVRLWPLSRKAAPKHLIPLTGERTLFQEAALRAAAADLFAPLTVIAGSEHGAAIAAQLAEIGAKDPTIVLEPIGRNTTAAAAIAALAVSKIAPEGLLLLMPADHLISDETPFRNAVIEAIPSARHGYLTLFGIRPTNPATGYGYIRTGRPLREGAVAREVAAFVEKPDQATAESYLESGEYLWNSGITLAPAATLLEALEKHAPEILASARAASLNATQDENFLRLSADDYRRCPAISLDYAVLEKSERVAVVPASFGWRDVGAFSALWEEAEHDDNGNAVFGNVLTESTADSYLRSEGRLLATLGVKDLIVIVTEDAVLVADKKHDQDIRKIVERLSARGDNCV